MGVAGGVEEVHFQPIGHALDNVTPVGLDETHHVRPLRLDYIGQQVLPAFAPVADVVAD